MVREKYRCIVCGRVFPKGQGIVVNYGKILLTFHSSKCASKFFRELLNITPYEELGKYVKELYDEYIEKLEVLEKKRSKKI